MSEYPWNEKNNIFTWLSSLYNPFKAFNYFCEKVFNFDHRKRFNRVLTL